ncbi:MAG: response regulator transcription factor [Bacteroidetes bacterium]|nr:response regulator transcription factor [Bacteroidota bacterium]
MSHSIILVDDSDTFREGLKFYLENILSCHVCAEASNGKEFMQLKNKCLADIILMDLEMPEMSGIETARLFLSEYSKNIIAITSYEDNIYLIGLKEAGFKGYINKKNIYDELQNAMKQVMGGKIYFPEMK